MVQKILHIELKSEKKYNTKKDGGGLSSSPHAYHRREERLILGKDP